VAIDAYRASAGDEAVAHLRALTDGFGVHSVRECVGSDQAIRTAIDIVLPGGAVGRVVVRHYEASRCSTTISAWAALLPPVRAYIAELLPDVLEGRIEPGGVFDRLVGLDHVQTGIGP
jgi:threonine dehydrogenase-like Zn-dependent dehydrogenase